MHKRSNVKTNGNPTRTGGEATRRGLAEMFSCIYFGLKYIVLENLNQIGPAAFAVNINTSTFLNLFFGF